MATIRTRKKADGSSSYLVQIRINRDKVTVYQESQTFARKQAAGLPLALRFEREHEPGAVCLIEIPQQGAARCQLR